MSTPVLTPPGRIIVRFILGQGLVSRGIAWWTNSLFSHVEFGTPEGTWIGAHDHGGIEERPANYSQPVREYIYAVPCSMETQTSALAWMRSQVGKTPYNFGDIGGLLFHVRKWVGSSKRRICSEFVILGLLQFFGAERVLNVLGTSWAAARITPETAHLAAVLVGHRIKTLG